MHHRTIPPRYVRGTGRSTGIPPRAPWLLRLFGVLFVVALTITLARVGVVFLIAVAIWLAMTLLFPDA